VGKSSVDIWMDYSLQGNDPITSTIMDELAGSALLLFVFSESYLASGWCKSELNGFLNSSVGDRKVGAMNRLFMVHRDKIDRYRLPPALQDLLGYQFWFEDFGRSRTVLGYPKPDLNNPRIGHACTN
jgi:TIR domain